MIEFFKLERQVFMINIDKLLESKRVEITFTDIKVDREFVKFFRKNNNLTQNALANIIGVTKKTIEKWEQGTNNINGSSAVLLKLLNDNPELIGQLYKVKLDVEGKRSDEYRSISSKVINTSSNHKSQIVSLPFVALF